MEQIKIYRKKFNPKIIQQAVSLLKRGGIIIYPTETAYAIGGDALKREVIKKIFQLKSRSRKIPLPVIVGTFQQAQKIGFFDQRSKKWAKKYWPGPLTLLLKKKKAVPSLLTAGKTKVAVRIPGLSFTRELAMKFNRPLISTSANLSGQKECYTVMEVLKRFPKAKKEVDLILDVGRLSKVKPSTIVEVVNGKIKVIREGPVELKIIE